MKDKTRIVVVSITILSVLIVGSLFVTAADWGDSKPTVEGNEADLLRSALNEPRNYDYTREFKTGKSVDNATLVERTQVSNSEGRYRREIVAADPTILVYGNGAVTWESKGDGNWEMTPEPKDPNWFSKPPAVAATDVHVIADNSSETILEIRDKELIVKMLSDVPDSVSTGMSELRLTVRIDDETRVDRIVVYSRHENEETGLYHVYDYKYNSPSVERPESIPFSLHERIRLLLYELGLL